MLGRGTMQIIKIKIIKHAKVEASEEYKKIKCEISAVIYIQNI